jgi:hypothetical protein
MTGTCGPYNSGGSVTGTNFPFFIECFHLRPFEKKKQKLDFHNTKTSKVDHVHVRGRLKNKKFKILEPQTEI